MQSGLPSLSTTEHLTKLPKDYKIFYERPRNQPTRNSMILRCDSTSLISTYLYSQDPMAITLMMMTCSTPFRNVFHWNNSYIASNTMTKSINDLLEYYGKLEQQEAKRKLKTHHQDNNKSQQQSARNQNQCHQGNQNQHHGNNFCNEESFCSYHQLQRHSDAECCDPQNLKGVMPTMPIAMIRIATVTTTTNKIATTKKPRIVETTSNATTIIQHALGSKGKKATNNKKLPMTAASILTYHSESDNEVFALEEKHSINNNDQSIITKQDYVPEIAIGVLADIVTKQYKYL
jgi:hypothetical protein